MSRRIPRVDDNADMADYARELWREARPLIIAKASEALAAAQAWAEEGDSAAWRRLAELSHQLAGSLGTYAAAMRPPDDGPAATDDYARSDKAAAAAIELDAWVNEPEPDSGRILAGAQRLVDAIEGT